MNKLNNETAKWITANTECDQTQLFSICIVIKKKKKNWKRNVKETKVFEVHGNKLYNNGKTLCEE